MWNLYTPGKVRGMDGQMNKEPSEDRQMNDLMDKYKDKMRVTLLE